MTFREKVKRVFRSSKSDTSKPKIEYYRRHECPPSKFKGPFDRDHQKRLAAWSFEGATVEKRRSFEVSLSPCATFDSPDSPVSDSVSPDSVDPVDSVDPGTHSTFFLDDPLSPYSLSGVCDRSEFLNISLINHQYPRNPNLNHPLVPSTQAPSLPPSSTLPVIVAQ